MTKATKTQTFQMLKDGQIQATNSHLQTVYNLLLQDCETLNDLKAELSEAKYKNLSYQDQISRGSRDLWYQGTKVSNCPKAVYYTSLWLEACDAIANELGYKFDRHFLISLKNINMNTIKRQRDGVKLTKYLTRNGYTFYRDEIGKRFKTLDGIVFTPYN